MSNKHPTNNADFRFEDDELVAKRKMLAEEDAMMAEAEAAALREEQMAMAAELEAVKSVLAQQQQELQHVALEVGRNDTSATDNKERHALARKLEELDAMRSKLAVHQAQLQEQNTQVRAQLSSLALQHGTTASNTASNNKDATDDAPPEP